MIDTTADPIVVRGTNPVTIATADFVDDGEGDATFVSVDTNDATAIRSGWRPHSIHACQ